MKTFIACLVLTLAFAVSAFAQMGDMKGKPSPTEKDKNEAIPTGVFLKRGSPIGTSAKLSLNAVLADPAKFSGKSVLIEGFVVRSCKMQGCWAEVAQDKDSKSVRIEMKDHSFFIPLASAGALARVEGTIQIKTLTKAMADKMVTDDGAKFEKLNPDGSVTQVSFEATGIELKRPGK